MQMHNILQRYCSLNFAFVNLNCVLDQRNLDIFVGILLSFGRQLRADQN